MDEADAKCDKMEEMKSLTVQTKGFKSHWYKVFLLELVDVVQ